MIAWVFGTIVMFFSASNGICGPRGFPVYFFKNDANCAAGSSPVCLTNKKGGSNLKVGPGYRGREAYPSIPANPIHEH